MSGFLEKILSGRYPELEALWRGEFGKLLEEVFGSETNNDSAGLDDYVDDIDDDWDDGVEVELAELRSRHEAVLRELECLKAERRELLFRLDRITEVVGSSRYHAEPL